VAQLNLTEV